jgi:Cof subfamily protein (haloacid dehalogenase superfamily)
MAESPAPATQTIAAVLADVDGTLLTQNKVLTPRAIAAVKQLQERGVLFAITSARPPRGMRMLVEPLGMTVPMAAFNGGVIVLPDLTVVDERAIPADVAPAVVETIRAYGLSVWIYHATEWYVTDPHGPHVERAAVSVQFAPTVVPTYDGFLDRAVKIVGVSDDHDLVARCETAAQQRFAGHVSAARSQPYYLDVTHPTANKGVVVERLSHYFKIPLKHVATIGDQLNDVLMFRRSGLSVAMGNASEEVQRQATYVTTSHEDEGFANAIERFILPRAAPVPAAARAE